MDERDFTDHHCAILDSIDSIEIDIAKLHKEIARLHRLYMVLSHDLVKEYAEKEKKNG